MRSYPLSISWVAAIVSKGIALEGREGLYNQEQKVKFLALNSKLALEIDGRVAMIIFDKDTIEEKQKLNALLPMAIDEYQLTMEEVFLNEMEDKKYDITKIFEK